MRPITIQKSPAFPVVGFLALFLVCQTAPTYAVEVAVGALKPTEVMHERKVETKTISGEISARNLNGIALVYAKNTKKRSSREMWLPYDSELKLVGYESKANVGEGDYVRATYDEMVDEGRRVLTGIELVKKFEPPAEEVEKDEEKEKEVVKDEEK